MSAGTVIPLHVCGADEVSLAPGLPGSSLAIVHEILNMLETLAASGERGEIDLRSLPMAPGEYSQLKALLGTGEAKIRLDLAGPTHCQETGISGVWWIRHCDLAGSVVAEFIEVAPVPALLVPTSEDLQTSVLQLQQSLTNLTTEDHQHE